MAFDFGITNTDVVINNKSKNRFFTFPTEKIDKNFISKILSSIEVNLNEIKNIAVTGGKSNDLDDEYMSIPITKINEVDAIGTGVNDIYKTCENPFVAISAGTGTACIYHADGKFNYLGGISIGGGTLQGLSKHLINNTNNEDIEELAIAAGIIEIDDEEIDKSQIRVDTFRASGAGGQHVNKTDSAVRITHLPSGLVVECQDGRSQHKNKTKALSLLSAKLKKEEEENQQAEIASERKILVGSGDRSEKIRTYNFPQGRVTDHRIKLTQHNLDQVMDGDIRSISDALIAENQLEMLAQLELDLSLIHI